MLFVGALLFLGLALWLYSYRLGRMMQGNNFVRLTNTGKNYYDRGDGEKAVAAFEQAAALAPTQADAHLNLANACLLANQPARALEEARQALEIDRHLAAAFYVAGCAQLRLGNAEEALKALQQAQAIDPAVTALNFQLSIAYERAGHLEDAIRELQTVIQFEPEHAAAHYRLSQLLARSGQKEEAAKELDRYRELKARQPNEPAGERAFEQCKFTQIRLPFELEQPERNGVQVAFTDATSALFGDGGKYHGPVGVVDLNHDGWNSLFVGEENGFRFLVNSNGTLQPQGDVAPGEAGANYRTCLVGDLQNDRVEDVLVLGEKASHVFKLQTNAAMTDVTKFAGLANLKARDGVLLDFDFTGKLDLLTLEPGGTGSRLYRNLGNFYFIENTATSGLPATVSGGREIWSDDWNNDDLLDVFITRADAKPLLLTKQRGGGLQETNTPSQWPPGTVLVTGDLNNDLRVDLVVAAPDHLELIFHGVPDHLKLPLDGKKVSALYLVDYDNDGWLDIAAAGDGVRLWRNCGKLGLEETTKTCGLNRATTGSVEALAPADFDRDGDTDFVLAMAGGGLRYLRNDGGNSNHQLKVRLVGNRSNASGLGMRVEVTAGGLRTIRTVERLPLEIGVGQHTNVDSMTVRWFDLTLNTMDVKVEPDQVFTSEEFQIASGSCPFLYAWDGKGFRFVTDLLGAAPAGLPVSSTHLVEADPDEYVWIGDETGFPARHGRYAVQITEELREVLYLDQARLVVVDHPAGTEAHTTGKMVPAKPWPPKDLVTLGKRVPLLKALRRPDEDVTAPLQEVDGRMVSPVRLRVPQLRGLAEPYSVTLDFGPLPERRPLELALTGWLLFGGGMANVAASQNPDLPFPFPKLEAEVNGEWEDLPVVVGVPAGKTKTILVDLNGKLPPDARRLRLTTAFELHWDRIALFEREDGAATRITTLEPDRTDLHWRGFSAYKDLPRDQPLTPDYERVSPYAKWRITPSGWCTRYGPVDELIAARDNALALVNGGDELTLEFDADRLPPKPPGFVRDFFLFSTGWDKDADFHCVAGDQVEPLPWHGMNDQLYGQEKRPALPADKVMNKYNTRWVGPYTLTKGGRE